MTTNILALPLLSFGMTVANNEDWLDSWAYIDSSGNPISLAGITITFATRQGIATSSITGNTLVYASTLGPITPYNGSVIIGGVGSNVLSLQIPKAVMSHGVVGGYVFEAQAQGDGFTRTIASGSVTVTQGLIS